MKYDYSHSSYQSGLSSKSYVDTHWSTVNVSEAFPGVLTPMGWSLCGDGVELGIRDAYARIGCISRKDVRIPAKPEDRLISVFFGRGALNANFFCTMGARMPGVDAGSIAREFLGEVPGDIKLVKSYRRLPAVLLKSAYTQTFVRQDILRKTAPIHDWWQGVTSSVLDLDIAPATRLFAESRSVFREMLRIQAAGLFVAVQPAYSALTTLCQRWEIDDDVSAAIVSGQGAHAEADMITDLWLLGSGRIPMSGFLSRHGYHGPSEGSVSGVVWREDVRPVEKLMEQYSRLSTNPSEAAAARNEQRRHAEASLLRSIPMAHRPHARRVLSNAANRIPLRGVAKASFLQALDCCRATARVIGTHLASRGVLESADDVFFLTADELVALPPDVTSLVNERRLERAWFEQMSLGQKWQGPPVPLLTKEEKFNRTGSTVEGAGVSPGVVEGVVRLVSDSDSCDTQAGEVVVCSTTDPSWASVLYLSAALVVDVGGALSHAAVVARELGIPCVVGTGNGTTQLRTGDRVRVDGRRGLVEMISPQKAASA